MPYTIATAPPAVKKLPSHAQEIWVSAWNNAYKHYGNEEQAFKVAWAAVSKYREDLHPDFRRILDLFVKRYGDEAHGKFQLFIQKNKLNMEKPYDPMFQFRESFQWMQPLIQQYKKDREAKYYRVVALTANISMNNNDYSDFAKLSAATPSLAYRPVNINHDHTRWLSFPRNRVDFVKADDFSVEATLRIDNREKEIQDLIDNGEILHPSIEGRPNAEGMGGGFHFTGLALLQKGVELPGDPLTEIKPLMFNESIRNAVCRLVDGKLHCNSVLKINKGDKMTEKIGETEPVHSMCVCPQCGELVKKPADKSCDLMKCPRESCNGHQMRIATKDEMGLAGGEKLIYKMLGEAEWDFAYKAALPDSAYAYVEPSCDSQACRHMPFKNKNGEIDRPHLAAALQAVGGARQENPPPYAAQAKAKLCAAAKSVGMDSTVCGTAESLEKEDKIFELFRPPFGDTEQHPDDANKRFAKSIDSPDMQVSTTTVQATPGGRPGAVKPILPPLAEQLSDAKKTIADLTDGNLKLEKDKAFLEEKIRQLTDENVEVKEENAKIRRENAKYIGMKGQVGEKAEELEKEKQAHKETKKILEATQNQVLDLKKRDARKDNEMSKLREDVASLTAQVDQTRQELHESLEKTASSNQKAINETQNRAKIQNDNAILSEKNAKLTREISDLSEQRAVDAKKLLKQEEEIKSLKESIVEKDRELEKKDKALHDAIIENKKAIKTMKRAGLVRLQK